MAKKQFAMAYIFEIFVSFLPDSFVIRSTDDLLSVSCKDCPFDVGCMPAECTGF